MIQVNKDQLIKLLTQRGKTVPTYMEKDFLDEIYPILTPYSWAQRGTPNEYESIKAKLIEWNVFYPLLWAYSIKQRELQKERKRQGRLKQCLRELGVID